MGCCCKKTEKDREKESISDSGSENLVVKEEESNPQNIRLTIDDFERLKLLGKGAFGRVMLVKLKATGKLYAMKVLDKLMIKKRNQQQHTQTERDLMVQVRNPFIVKIQFAFQDNANLYICTEFMQGGEMFYHIYNEKKFSLEKTRFYAAELVLALEFLHANKMVYRDLKPENILMDSQGHIKVTDFGLSKIFDKDEIAKTICGTPQYLAPEILTHKYEYSVDWFSLGCVVYLMLMGRPAYRIPKGQKPNLEIYKKIKIPSIFTPETKSFLKGLLSLDPKKRLGYGKNGSENIKKHAFFKGMDWKALAKKKIKPPFVPALKDEEDLKYFDKLFTDEPVDDDDDDKPEGRGTNYRGFTYVPGAAANEMLGAKQGIELKERISNEIRNSSNNSIEEKDKEDENDDDELKKKDSEQEDDVYDEND